MTPYAARIVKNGAATVGALFGVATLAEGGRVVLGADPGYVVFRPLLFFNVAMGAAYIAAGIALWRSVAAGRVAAGAIFALNLLVLAGIAVVRQGGGAVAAQSIAAMTLRTVVWLVLFLAAWRTGRATEEA